jgi:hypothetical protein
MFRILFLTTGFLPSLCVAPATELEIHCRSRWMELKPKGAPQGNPQVVLMKIEEYSRSLEEYRSQMEQINRVIRVAHVSIMECFSSIVVIPCCLVLQFNCGNSVQPGILRHWLLVFT